MGDQIVETPVDLNNNNNIKSSSRSNSSSNLLKNSSPRVPRISLSILTGNSNNNSNSGGDSPLESKSRSPLQRTPRSSPSTPKKSKAKMEGTPTNLSQSSGEMTSSSKYSPLSLISPRKNKGKKDKNKLNLLQQQLNESNSTTTSAPTAAATNITITTAAATTNNSNQTTTNNNSNNTNGVGILNSTSSSPYNDDLSSTFNNSSSRDDIESPLSSSITASISTDSLHQASLGCETPPTTAILSPPPSSSSSYTYHPLPSSSEEAVPHDSSTSLLVDETTLNNTTSQPSSTSSTPLLTDQSNRNNQQQQQPPPPQINAAEQLLQQQNNVTTKKRFFSFLSRKPKPPPMSIERKTSPPLPLSSASVTPPQALSTNTTPNLVPITSMSYQQQQQLLQPRRMSASLDSLKTVSPSVTPNYAFSPVVSPVIPPSPLKTSILRNRSNSSSFYSSSGMVGGSISLGSSNSFKKIEYNHLNHTYSSSAVMIHTSMINSPLNPNHINNALGSHTALSIATDATWLMIASNWEEWSEPHYRSTLTKYIYQGIPDRFRQTIWFHLSNMIQQTARIPTCIELSLQYKLERFQPQLTPLSTPSNQTPISTPLIRSQSSSSIIPPAVTSPQQSNNNVVFEQLTTTTTTNHSPLNNSTTCKNHKCFYQSILKHHSEHEEQIDVDIQRSFTDIPDNIRDSYALSLSRVLKAISLYDSEMGYCQGISFVGSILITRVPEEETFHILLRLLEGVMRDFYTVGMMGLKLRLFQLSKFVQDLFPKLHKHLEQIDLDYTIFASPWFMTAFSYHLSEECSVRILDVILLQGVEAFFSVGLAIFQIIEDDLLKCTDSSQAMEYFRCNAKANIDVSTLMDIASRITVSPHQLANFKSQFEALNTKPSIPTEFNPDQQPKEKMKDPNWVVKKYKLKEYINILEEDLAIIKRELHETHKKNEEEKIELVKHLQELSDRESHLIEQKRMSDTNYQMLLQENEELKKKLHKSEECNNFLADQMRVLRSKVTQELWNNNPKNSIQWT
ncbi:RabGAP/TBC domain-containing protein [Heterostelium album PN500]|uniref:RabGAP/TBC domain-containing protein n=1 Tax=Heterostelium pallidum (strain ATCC 26659 / Pp 5 / PN500) TaxID=670386 RepID=D3BB97_HETP5|nr:RabGAP/TBC domain-containing protein [Heterostelium album PN500]EFA81304.1 RabGAP/TBC domain-containing protein [Heterostelium album PN500]|eukprot:XP_020433422.1 RabGAP/TBC domain-containing protein [Heterostelium album PN500]